MTSEGLRERRGAPPGRAVQLPGGSASHLLPRRGAGPVGLAGGREEKGDPPHRSSARGEFFARCRSAARQNEIRTEGRGGVELFAVRKVAKALRMGVWASALRALRVEER